MRIILLGLGFWAAMVSFAADDETVIALTTSVPCRSEPHPETRRIFACADRVRVLEALGLPRCDLRNHFTAGMVEHEMVKAAIGLVGKATALSAVQKAVYWEELAAIIQTHVGKPVSQSFHGLFGGQSIYVFQGLKRFEGKAYILVMLPSGEVRTGRAEPIENISEWATRLEELSVL